MMLSIQPAPRDVIRRVLGVLHILKKHRPTHVGEGNIFLLRTTILLRYCEQKSAGFHGTQSTHGPCSRGGRLVIVERIGEGFARGGATRPRECMPEPDPAQQPGLWMRRWSIFLIPPDSLGTILNPVWLSAVQFTYGWSKMHASIAEGSHTHSAGTLQYINLDRSNLLMEQFYSQLKFGF